MTTLATIWQAITLLVKYLPVVIDAINRGEDFIELKIALKKLNDAENKAEASGDTSDIEAIFHPKSDSK